MSQTLESSTPPGSGSSPGRGPQRRADESSTASSLMSRARRDQLISVVLGVVLLAASIAMQGPLREDRKVIVKEKKGSMAEIAIAFPRFTLGGFRGLLATTLWIKAEDAKNNRQWVELNTLYNMIGTLQPYFNTVYIYNAWNQAYNLSAQWHDWDDKYRWVLDGLNHLYEGEEYNPADVDLEVEQAQMYFLKLGGAFERIYYRHHWKYDIANLHLLKDDADVKDSPDINELREVKSFVMRPQFNTELLTDNHGKKGFGVKLNHFYTWGPLHDNEFGLKLTPLDPKDPKREIEFPHGISPFYFAYCEYLRCLQSPRRPSNIGFGVVRFYPWMSLRLWIRDDLYDADDIMRTIFLNPPEDYNADKYNNDVLAARDEYRNVAIFAPIAIDGFSTLLRYIKDNEGKENDVPMGLSRTSEGTHRKHVMETQWYQAIGQAQSELFEGLVAWHENKNRINDSVVDHLKKAKDLYEAANKLGDAWSLKVYPPYGKQPNPDIKDYTRLRDALQARADAVATFLNTPADQQPDFSFLRDNPIDK